VNNPFLTFDEEAWARTTAVLKRVTNSEPLGKDPFEVLVRYFNELLALRRIGSKQYKGDLELFKQHLLQGMFPGSDGEAQLVIGESLVVKDFGRIPRLTGRSVRIQYHSKTGGHVDVNWFGEHQQLPLVRSSVELIYRLSQTHAPEDFKQLQIAAFQSVSEFQYSNLKLVFELLPPVVTWGSDEWSLIPRPNRGLHPVYMARWRRTSITIMQALRAGKEFE